MINFLSLCLLLLVPLAIAKPDAAKSISEREFGEVCYDDLGCYNLIEHFHPIYRPIPVPPMARLLVHTTFHLYTKSNRPDSKDNAQTLKAGDSRSVDNSNFDPSKPTKFIVHGYFDSATVTWVLDLAAALLTAEDLNVITVDWSIGSRVDYFSSASNTWVVGGETWLLIKYFVEHYGAKYDDMHIIGHSLGSHVAGYAGARTNGKLGRISAMDPAQPLFKHLNKVARLDHLDAQFVDAIHTDAKTIWLLGYGMTDTVGHIDFYPNEGKHQPGCFIKAGFISLFKEGMVAGMRDFFACNHQRAIFMYTESILSKCPFVAHLCTDYDAYEHGQCLSCGADNSLCARVGYYANQHPDPKDATDRKFFLTTADQKPLCVYHYAVTVTLSKPQEHDGSLGMIFHSTNGVTHGTHVDAKATTQSHTIILKHPDDFGKVSKLDLKWTVSKSFNPLSWFRKAEALNVQKIVVEPMDVLPETARKLAATTLCQKDRKPMEHDELYTLAAGNC